MIKTCAKCGSEFETKGNGKWCDNCKPNVRAKEIIEAVEKVKEEINLETEEDLRLQIERLKIEKEELALKLAESEKELEPTLEEIEAKYSAQKQTNSDLISAIYLLKEHVAKSKDIQHLLTRQSTLDQLKNDHLHLMELGKVRTKTERDTLFVKEMECFVERRVVKNQIAIYQALQKLEGFTRIDYSTIIPVENRVYKPRVLDCGIISQDSKINIIETSEKPTNLDAITTTEFYKYVESLNLLPLTSKISTKSVNFKVGNLEDLKTKIQQMRTSKMAYKSFRVERALLKCYM